jgi:hypothetical protein
MALTIHDNGERRGAPSQVTVKVAGLSTSHPCEFADMSGSTGRRTFQGCVIQGREEGAGRITGRWLPMV